MALSDLIRKVEDKLEEWPRSAKIVAGGSVVLGAAVAAFALYTLMNQPRYEPEPAQVNNIVMERNSNTQNFQVPAAPQPVPSPVPTSTQVPTPTSTPTSPSTSTPVPSPTPKPTKTSVEKQTPTSRVKTPIHTPTPAIDDYYVIINQGPVSNNGKGLIAVYDRPEHIESGFVTSFGIFRDEDLFINYLLSQGVITPEQKNAYYTPVSPEKLHAYNQSDAAKFLDEDVVGNIKIHLRTFANAIPKLHHLTQDKKSPFYQRIIQASTLEKRFLPYADKELLDPSNYGVPSEDGGYVVINGNNVQTVVVDEHGNTTSVDVEIAGIDEVLDYWRLCT